MAYQLAYSLTVPYQTDPLVFSTSYWVPQITQLNKVQETCTVEFLGYANQAARTAKQAPIATVTYVISGANWTTYIAPAFTIGGPNLFAQLYLFAKTNPIRQYNPKATPVVFFKDSTNS